MSFVDPATIQVPAVDLLATHGWGDSVNTAMNWLQATKAGCMLTTAVSTATGTDTAIPFATETWDVNGCHDTAVNTTRITVPTNWAGLWAVGANLRCAGDLFTMWIRVGGTTKIGGCSSNASGSVPSAESFVVVYPMTVGQYFEVVVTGGTNIDTTSPNRFWAYWLHGI